MAAASHWSPERLCDQFGGDPSSYYLSEAVQSTSNFPCVPFAETAPSSHVNPAKLTTGSPLKSRAKARVSREWARKSQRKATAANDWAAPQVHTNKGYQQAQEREFEEQRNSNQRPTTYEQPGDVHEANSTYSRPSDYGPRPQPWDGRQSHGDCQPPGAIDVQASPAAKSRGVVVAYGKISAHNESHKTRETVRKKTHGGVAQRAASDVEGPGGDHAPGSPRYTLRYPAYYPHVSSASERADEEEEEDAGDGDGDEAPRSRSTSASSFARVSSAGFWYAPNQVSNRAATGMTRGGHSGSAAEQMVERSWGKARAYDTKEKADPRNKQSRSHDKLKSNWGGSPPSSPATQETTPAKKTAGKESDGCNYYYGCECHCCESHRCCRHYRRNASGWDDCDCGGCPEHKDEQWKASQCW